MRSSLHGPRGPGPVPVGMWQLGRAPFKLSISRCLPRLLQLGEPGHRPPSRTRRRKRTINLLERGRHRDAVRPPPVLIPKLVTAGKEPGHFIGESMQHVKTVEGFRQLPDDPGALSTDLRGSTRGWKPVGLQGSTGPRRLPDLLARQPMPPSSDPTEPCSPPRTSSTMPRRPLIKAGTLQPAVRNVSCRSCHERSEHEDAS